MDTLELGEFGVLLGLAKNTVAQRDVWKDSRTVNINMGLKFITIGCGCINTLKNFDINGKEATSSQPFQ